MHASLPFKPALALLFVKQKLEEVLEARDPSGSLLDSVRHYVKRPWHAPGFLSSKYQR